MQNFWMVVCCIINCRVTFHTTKEIKDLYPSTTVVFCIVLKHVYIFLKPFPSCLTWDWIFELRLFSSLSVVSSGFGWTGIFITAGVIHAKPSGIPCSPWRRISSCRILRSGRSSSSSHGGTFLSLVGERNWTRGRSQTLLHITAAPRKPVTDATVTALVVCYSCI